MGSTPQTISFASFVSPVQPPFASPLTVAATATSSLAVAYSIAEVSGLPGGSPSIDAASGVITLAQGGTFTVTANQAGNGTYAAAPAATLTFTALFFDHHKLQAAINTAAGAGQLLRLGILMGMQQYGISQAQLDVVQSFRIQDDLSQTANLQALLAALAIW